MSQMDTFDNNKKENMYVQVCWCTEIRMVNEFHTWVRRLTSTTQQHWLLVDHTGMPFDAVFFDILHGHPREVIGKMNRSDHTCALKCSLECWSRVEVFEVHWLTDLQQSSNQNTGPDTVKVAAMIKHVLPVRNILILNKHNYVYVLQYVPISYVQWNLSIMDTLGS